MPPASPQPTPGARRGRPSRRPEIFAAALRLFRERGFHATSIKDIGAEAGVTGTALYAHFETKQELLAEAIRAGATRLGAGMREALAAEAPTAEQALANAVRGYVEAVLDDPDMNACYVLESRNLDPAAAQPLRGSERRLRKVWAERLLAVRPELSADEARAMVQMAIFSIVALCLHHSRIERGALVDLATSFVLGALARPASQPTT